MAEKNYILNRVRQAVYAFDPDAEIILYGSQARGSAAPDSDWDFLVLTEIELDNTKKRDISCALYKIEWETCEVISPIIHTKRYWYRTQNRVTPFYQNVTSEGVRL